MRESIPFSNNSRKTFKIIRSFFGRIFRINTFGESHAKQVGVVIDGVVIDGVPSRHKIDIEAIQQQLDRQRPGQSCISTDRNIIWCRRWNHLGSS